MKHRNILESKVHITGKLTFDTAFHIGSGQEGEMATDMGVLLEQGSGVPILPGSSLKGKFRSTAERLAGLFGMTACLLDMGLSGVSCVTDEPYRTATQEQYRTRKNDRERLDWLEDHVCGVCKLFGSPLHSSRIFFSDGRLQQWSGTTEIRDGVCIDRDSETARDSLKYDFEVVPADAAFQIVIDLENPGIEELALVGAVLVEWEHGVRLGGMSSRGLGLSRLHDLEVHRLDYTDPKQIMAYFLDRRMTPAPDLFRNALEAVLTQKGGAHA